MFSTSNKLFFLVTIEEKLVWLSRYLWLPWNWENVHDSLSYMLTYHTRHYIQWTLTFSKTTTKSNLGQRNHYFIFEMKKSRSKSFNYLFGPASYSDVYTLDKLVNYFPKLQFLFIKDSWVSVESRFCVLGLGAFFLKV